MNSITFFIAPLVAYIIYFILNRYVTNDEKLEDSTTTRTHDPKVRTLYSLVLTAFMLVLFVINVVTSILNHKIDDTFFFTAIFLFALMFLPLITTIGGLCNHEIIKLDGIMVHRILKKKLVSYNEMVKYKQYKNRFIILGEHGKILFIVFNDRIGLKSLLNALEEHGIIAD